MSEWLNGDLVGMILSLITTVVGSGWGGLAIGAIVMVVGFLGFSWFNKAKDNTKLNNKMSDADAASGSEIKRVNKGLRIDTDMINDTKTAKEWVRQQLREHNSTQKILEVPPEVKINEPFFVTVNKGLIEGEFVPKIYIDKMYNWPMKADRYTEVVSLVLNTAGDRTVDILVNDEWISVPLKAVGGEAGV